jgi:acylphosphatase
LARALGLSGWARNLADGRVEILAEGGEPNIRALLDWCRRGPSLARVDRVEATEETPTGEFSEFRVRRDG